MTQITSFKFFGLKPIYWLLFVVFDLHMFVAALPGNNLVFDEIYYQPAALDMLRGVAYNFEHPPLVKAIVALSITALGDNWLAWRLPIVLFSVLATFLTYKIAAKFLSERASLFAALLLSLSVTFLVVGSFALLDVPCIAFGLLGLYLVLDGRYGLGGLAFGLSFLCKELGALLFLVAFVFLVVRRVGGWRVLFFSGVAFFVSFAGLWLYDFVYKPADANMVLSNPVEQYYFMVVYQLNLNHIRAPSAARWFPPVDWVSPFGHNGLAVDVWVKVLVGRVWTTIGVIGSPAVEYFMFPLLVALPVLYWRRRDVVALVAWLWIGLSYVPWLLAGFFVRTESSFYVAFSAPFLAIGSAYLYSFIPDRRLKYGLAFAQLVVGVVFFVWFGPFPYAR